VLIREGYRKELKRILSNIKTFHRGRVIINTPYPEHSMYPSEDHLNLAGFYPDNGEGIPRDLPPKKVPRVRMIVYLDFDHTHHLFTNLANICNIGWQANIHYA
jgi:hypothetical protein